MIRSINPYLTFERITEEAFNFYKSVFGGEFSEVVRYKDMKQFENADQHTKELIAHIALPLGSHYTLKS